MREHGNAWKYGMAVCLAVMLAAGSPASANAQTEENAADTAIMPEGQAGLQGAAGRELSATAAAVAAGAQRAVNQQLAQRSDEGEESNKSGGGTEGEAPEEELSEEEKKREAAIDNAFEDTVFVGDSIMLGFRNYAMKRQDTFLEKLEFLAAGSFSADNALWPVDEKSVHPVYQGKQRPVWESIAMMKGRRIFLMLGMNDLNVYGLEGSCAAYRELIGNILEANPEAEIHIMSMTYVLQGKEKDMLRNDTIRQYNEMLRQMAKENRWGYVDVAEALADEKGNLKAEYCSDDFVHQNPKAYDVWVKVLREYVGGL